MESFTSIAAGSAAGFGVVFLAAGRANAMDPLWVTALSLVFLAVLGAVGARAGGAPVPTAVFRVTFWGAFAMALTIAIGSLFEAPLG